MSASSSNVQLIIRALADYSKQTGIDLSNNPFATALEQSNSTDTILQLLQQREKAFKEYRDSNRRLINCISPAVKVIQAFSGILGEAACLVPFPPAKALFVGIDTLLDAASRVSSSYDALLNLFECLTNFLKRLEVYTMMPPTPVMTDIIVKIMIEILSVLALATKQIKEGRFKKFAKKLLGDSEIEATVERLDRLTQDEARMTVAQTLSVVHGLVGNVKVIMEDREVSTNSIRQDLVALHQELHEINKIKRDQLQRDVQHWLSPPDPSMNQNFVSEARQTGTTAWFIKSDILAEWQAKGSLLWIYGKPGAGKSTLLSAVIQEIESKHAAGLATMAYYYFDFRDVKKQDCYGLLTSLISQFSAESDSCYDVLSQLYSANNRGTRKPSISALKACMTDMLSLPGQGPVYLIVDALDECPNSSGNPSSREKVLKVIEELVELKLPNIYLCVASRPETDIRLVLEPLTTLKICLHDEIGQKNDILEYINSIIRSDSRMRRWKEEDKQLVVDTLSSKADGMFRYVVCQVDRLRRSFPISIRKILNDLPKTLDETYDRTLLNIDEEKREFALRLFRCLVVSIRSLRLDELAEILAIQFDEVASPTFNPAWRPENAEEAVISACSSLVAIVDKGGDQVVQFSHFSVKEYLTSERLAAAEERLSYYHILPESAHTILAHASLSVLLELDDRIDRSTIADFPLAPYAARYWVDHAKYRSVSLQVQKAMERLFNPAMPHFAAWVWLYDIDQYWMEHMPTMHPTQPGAVPLYYASLCGFVGLAEGLIAIHSRDVNSKGGSNTTPLHAASVKGHLEVASLLLKNDADPNSRDDLGRVPLHRVSQGGQLVMPGSSLEIARLLINSGADVNVTDYERCAPLHAAAQSGYREIAELLLGSNATLDARNSKQETPLKLSCSNGKPEMAQFLIERGSDINLQDKDGFIPLHGASRGGHVDVAQLLLDCGSDVNARKADGVTPLHHALRYGHLDLARLLIDRDADVNALTPIGWTPLHQALRYGHLDLARLLIDRGADVSALKLDGRTPLHHALRYGHLDLARLLIDRDADVNALTPNGWTPLHQASRYGYLDLARLLIDRGADVGALKPDGSTPMHLATSSEHLDIVKLLIDRGANIDSRNHKQETPLALAAWFGHLEVTRFLIEKGTALSALDKDGDTPFHNAAFGGHLHVTKFLLECGINLDIRNQYGQTPLYLASAKGRLDVVCFLIEQGANIHSGDNNNSNALHISSRNGHLDVVRLLIDSGSPVDTRDGSQKTSLALASKEGNVEVGRFLIHQGADLNVRDNQNKALLHLASQHGHLDMVRLLLDHGVDPSIKRNDLSSPLHLVSVNGHFKIAELLVERGARVDISNDKQETPLHQAVTNGNSGIARLLINHGATVHAADDNGSTLLHAASQHGHLRVVKLLLRHGADVDALNKAGRSAAELASEKSQAEVARFISEYKENGNTQHKLRSTTLDTVEYGADDDGEIKSKASLHYAAKEGNINTVKSFLERGVDINARFSGNRTALDRAAAKGSIDVVRLLIERGAEVNSRDEWGWTPLHKSSRFGHLEVSRLLLDHGANVNARDQDYWTPMDLSAANGYLEIVKLLLERGADIHATNKEGQTTYQVSLRFGNREIADLLWKYGAGGLGESS